MGILVLLVTFIAPVVSSALNSAYNTRCRNNLAKIVQALHASHSEGTKLPTPETWVELAASNASKEVLRCDKDTAKRPEGIGGSFKDIYLLQYDVSSQTSHNVSFLVDALTPGKPVPDPQLYSWYPKAGIDKLPVKWKPSGYVPDQLAGNQAFVGIGDEGVLSCGVRITFGPSATIIESWPNRGGGGSRHWIMRGDGTPRCPLPMSDSPKDDNDEELLHLWSPASGYNMIDPRSPLRLATGPPVSYGMNAMVESSRWGPSQLLVMEAGEPVIRVGTPNHEDENAFSGEPDGVIKARHMGKVNVATCDGAVTGKAIHELRERYELANHGQWSSR
jgi:prepilin-type processing-associated H-X9-DG protein